VPHLLITLGDDSSPTWIDRALAESGRVRRVAARTRYFMSAPLVLARSDLLLTGPSMLVRYFAALVPLQVLEPPIELPTYPEEAYWHERFDADPGHAWLREQVRQAMQSHGLRERPRKRRW
jgi:DNA-binding transcriptional LysR family regulator